MVIRKCVQNVTRKLAYQISADKIRKLHQFLKQIFLENGKLNKLGKTYNFDIYQTDKNPQPITEQKTVKKLTK